MPWEYEDDSPGVVDLVLLALIGGVTIFYWKDILALFGGGIMIGGHVYPTTGRTRRCSNHTQTIGCGGGNSPSNRCDMENVPFTAYELTAQIQFGGGCGCGDEATLKHGGPPHQDGNCCWAISTVKQNGDVCFGGEGPHPSTSMCQQKLGNVGNLANKVVTIKSIFWATGSGAHQEVYVNGRKMGSRNMSSWGDNKTSNRVPSNQQIECRCDCSHARWLWAEAAEIRPPFLALQAQEKYHAAVAQATNKGREAVISDLTEFAQLEKPTLYQFKQELQYFPEVDVPKPPVAESFLTQRWLGRAMK